MPHKRSYKAIVRWLGKLALAAAATIIALLLGELLVRLIGHAPEIKQVQLDTADCVYKRSQNALLSFELKANYRNENPDLVQSYERTNAHGLRDRERTVDKPAGVRRVLLVGDSVVEGYKVREEETMSRQLEAMFPDGSTEVLNFGTSAYCTRAEIELLEVKGLQFRPDIVVLVFVENDFDNFNREAFTLEGTLQRSALVESLFLRSHLFRLACVQLNLFHFGAEADPVRWNQDATGENNVVDGMQRFRKLADEHGFRPVVAIWPRFFDDRIEDMHFLPDNKELIVERIAATHGIPSVRLSDHFRRDRLSANGLASPRLRYTTGDQLHPSPLGCRVAAEAIRSILADLEAGHLSSPLKNDDAQSTGATAIELAQELGKEKPTYSRVYERVGRELLRTDKPEEAIAQFTLALEEDPDNAFAHYHLGLAYRQMENAEKAQHHFNETVRLKPGFAPAHFELARGLLKEGETLEGITQLETTILGDPDHIDALNLLAVERSKQGDLLQAQMHLEHAVNVQPDHAESHNNLGVLLARKGQIRQAANHFQRAIRADPDHPTAGRNLVRAQALLDKKP